MPRRSAASLSVYQLPDALPEPPASLSKEAKQEWRAVVSRFRPTWFLGSESILAMFCETVAIERRTAAMLGQAKVGSLEWRRLIRAYLGICASMISSATRLRITPQSTRSDYTGKLAAPGPRPWADDDFIEQEPVGSS